MDCQHVFNRGKATGKRCPNNAKHDGYCHKHKKAVVPKEIDEAIAGPAPAARVKHKFSTFRWTANSNTSALKMTLPQIDEFKRALAFIFAEDKVTEFLTDKTNADPAKNIIKLTSQYFCERAPTTKAVHAHGAIKLEHTGFYHLRTGEIRDIISGILGKKIHFNVFAGGDADAQWEQYMAKNAAAVDKI